MAWIEPQRVPLLVGGLAMLVLAALLAAVDFRKRVNRAFAVVLGLRGISLVLGSLALGTQATLSIQAFQPYVSLALFPLLVLFASLFPKRRGIFGRPGMGWTTIAIVCLLWGVYLADHSTFYTLAEGTPPSPILAAGPGIYDASFGPLAFVGFGVFPLMAALGLLFARDYTRSEAGAQRTSYFLVASGFLVNGVFDGARQSVGLVRLLQDDTGFPWLPWGWTLAVLPALSLLLSAAGLVAIGIHRFRGRLDEGRRETRRERVLFTLAGLAAITGMAPLFLPTGSEFFSHPATLVVLGFWRLSLPLFVTHALLRYALFDIDLKVRAAVAWTFVVVVFGAVYFIVSETLEGQVSERFGNLGGLAAAALLTVAGGPLASLGRRVAKALMPGVKELEAVAPKAGEEIYRQQFLMLQEDGTLTEKERRSLDELRRHLGLAQARTTIIERAILGGSARKAARV